MERYIVRYEVRDNDGIEVGYTLFPDSKNAIACAEHFQIVYDAVVEVYDTVENKFLEV